MDVTKRKISRIARGASRFTTRIMRRQGVGSSELDFIMLVRHHPGLTQGEVCHRLELDKGAVARLAARLEAKGYLKREQNPDDGRSRLLYATEKADELRSSKARLEEFFYDWLLEPLSGEEKVEFARILDVLEERCHDEWRRDFTELTGLLEKNREEAPE